MSLSTHPALTLVSNLLTDPLLLLTFVNLLLLPLLSVIHFHILEPLLIAPLTRISVKTKRLQQEQRAAGSDFAKQSEIKAQLAQLQKERDTLIQSTVHSTSLFAVTFRVNRILELLLKYSAWLLALYLQFVDKRPSTAFSLGPEWGILHGWSVKPLYFLSFLRLLRS